MTCSAPESVFLRTRASFSVFLASELTCLHIPCLNPLQFSIMTSQSLASNSNVTFIMDT